MPILHSGPEFIVHQSVIGRFFAAAIEISRAGLRILARLRRIYRDRALLDELPDYLLRDIGIDRSEISSVTRFGAKGGLRGLRT